MVQLSLVCRNPSATYCRVFLFRADLLDKTSLPVCDRQHCLLSFNNYSLQVNNVPGIETAKGFPGGAVVKSLPANAGDTGSSPGLGGSHMPRSN